MDHNLIKAASSLVSASPHTQGIYTACVQEGAGLWGTIFAFWLPQEVVRAQSWLTHHFNGKV